MTIIRKIYCSGVNHPDKACFLVQIKINTLILHLKEHHEQPFAVGDQNG